MQQSDNLISVFKVIYKHRKVLIWTTLLVAIVSVAISLCLDNYYKSTTIFYAASPDLAKPSPVGSMEKNVRFFGEDEDLDRLFSVSKSGELSQFLIDKYGLYDHYDINKEDDKAQFKMEQKLNKLVTSKKTRYNALELSVEDKDKTLAMNMANDARNKIAEITQRLIKDSQKKLLDNYDSNISYKDEILKVLNDSITNVRAIYGVYNTISQGEVLSDLVSKTQNKLLDQKARLSIYKSNEALYRDSIPKTKTSISGLNEQMKSLNKKIDLFNKGLAKVVALEFEQRELTQQLSLDKERQKQLLAAYNAPFTALHLVDEAKIPVVKSWPKRSILVLGSTVFAFLMTLIGILLFNAYKNIDWKEITNVE